MKMKSMLAMAMAVLSGAAAAVTLDYEDEIYYYSVFKSGAYVETEVWDASAAIDLGYAPSAFGSNEGYAAIPVTVESGTLTAKNVGEYVKVKLVGDSNSGELATTCTVMTDDAFFSKVVGKLDEDDFEDWDDEWGCDLDDDGFCGLSKEAWPNLSPHLRALLGAVQVHGHAGKLVGPDAFPGYGDG